MVRMEPYANAAPVMETPGGALERTVALGFRLIEAAESFATSLDLPELGAITLPPVLGTAADQAHLRTVAPLYLAAEVEAAQLVPSVELLAGVFVTGGLQIDVGPSGRLLLSFWEGRHQRFAASERRAFFARLFGTFGGPTLAADGGSNTGFETLMLDLTEALYKLDVDPAEIGLRTAAGQLAANLLARSGGMALFAARDLLATVQTALTILGQAPVQQALGAHGVWGAVGAIARRYQGQPVEIASHVSRAQAGTLLLAWLAEHLPLLDAGSSLIALQDPIVDAAAQWLQASLTLHERDGAPTAPGN